jgi:uncharacterized membrane protein
VWVALLFGLPLAFITAPFQAPDEPQHFLRAYQIAEGGLLPVRRGEHGGAELPLSLIQVPHRFAYLRFHPDEKTSLAQIRAAMQVPLDPDRRQFIPFVTAIYSPVAYVPQAIAIAIGRQLALDPLGLMYLARCFNLLAWILLGYLALRITPACHRALLLLLLMPMSLFQAASMSADATTNGLAVLFAAMVMRMAILQKADKEPSRTDREGEAPAEPERIARERSPLGRSLALPSWVAITAISAALTLTKFAYLPLAASVLLIPSTRFGSRTKYLASLTAFFAANMAVILLWAPQTRGLNAVVNDDPRVSPPGQIEYLRTHPSAVITVAAHSIAGEGWSMVRSCVGWLGSMDARMNGTFIIAYLIALFLACWSERSAPAPIPLSRWISVTLIPGAFAIGAIGLLNYVFWTRVGLAHVEGLQGRYLLPIAPGIVYLVWALTRRLPGPPWSFLSQRKVDAIGTGITVLGSGYAIILVYFRYYVR